MYITYKLKQQYKTRKIEDGEQITHYNRKATDVFGIMLSTHIYIYRGTAPVSIHHLLCVLPDKIYLITLYIQ